MTTFTGLLDASVLVPLPTRDILVRLAVAGFYRARWSHEILDEMDRALRSRGMASARTIERNRACMIGAVPDCVVTGFHGLADHLVLPDDDDRHVVAAAIRANASVIVTANTRHFPARQLAPLGIESQDADGFVVSMIDLDIERGIAVVRQQRSDLQRRPLTAAEFLMCFERAGLPRSAALLGTYADLI